MAYAGRVLAIELNVRAVRRPRATTDTKMAIAINMIMSAYSTAVAPCSSISARRVVRKFCRRTKWRSISLTVSEPGNRRVTQSDENAAAPPMSGPNASRLRPFGRPREKFLTVPQQPTRLPRERRPRRWPLRLWDNQDRHRGRLAPR
jgi:hypothetical protein